MPTAPSPARTTAVSWLGRILAVAALIVVAYLGGVAATHLWPAHSQTRYLSAELSVGPALDRTLHVPAVVGEVLVDFDGRLPAPGLTAQVQVREEVTELLRAGRLDPTAVRPTSAELRSAIDQGVRRVALTFALGSATTVLLTVGAYAAARRGRTVSPWVAAGLAWAGVVSAAGGTAYLTYRTNNVAKFRATSLLSAVQSGSGLFDELDQRAAQGAAYITNLLALSDAMREEFTPADAQQPAAVTLLLVSDIHGMDHYPVMREVVRREGVDAVLDAGDLLNFGQPREGALTGLYAGIESLDVPYLFVRGNHDATSASDEALLRRMASVDNVVLMEPTAGTYQRASIGGVTVSGFNDSRFYADPTDAPGRDQAALAQRWTDATTEIAPTDVVMVHEPYAAQRVRPGQLTVNGHMHVQALQRGHLQAGSFTGGGLVNQFRLPPLTDQAREAVAEDPATRGELQGHPSSFDVLRFGGDCRLLSVTRYSYRDLVSGRPQFDDVSMVRGSSVALRLTDDEAERRTCGADQGIQVGPLVP